MYLLAGDAGGTKTVLALYQLAAGQGWQMLRRQQYVSAEFPGIEAMLDAFLADASGLPLQAVCIGVAGPIINGDCHTTNLPWEITRASLAKTLRTENIQLLNDLEAAAWGVLHSKADELVELNPRAEQGVAGNMAVIAAGTGLGEAILSWDGKRYHILATEGGHTDFGPSDECQDKLLRYLRAQYAGHVSYERLVSGEGLKNIYRFLKDTGFAEESAAIREQMQQQDLAAVIGKAGAARQDPLCTEAVDLFCRIYGAETGNLALKCLPFGGIYLAGGIAAKILPALQQDGFLQAYLDKGRYDAILAKIPLKVCLNPDVALVGAAQYAQTFLVKSNENRCR